MIQLRREENFALKSSFLLLCGFCLFSMFYPPTFPGVPFRLEGTRGNRRQLEIQVFMKPLVAGRLLPRYNYDVFDFCKDYTEKRSPVNLTQILFANRSEPSPYKFTFGKHQKCQPVCSKFYKKGNRDDATKLDFLKMAMQLNYQHQWIIDDMAVTWCYDSEDGVNHCRPGFPIGCLITSVGRAKDACAINAEFNKKNTFYIFNHVDIRIFYNIRELEGSRVARLVSAMLEPKSIKHLDPKAAVCKGEPMGIPVEFDDDVSITYSYSVSFEEDNTIKWANQWDYIGASRDHTSAESVSFAISFVVSGFLFMVVAMIVQKILRKIILQHNKADQVEPHISKEDAEESSGWKQIHGGIFCPPRNGMLLSAFVGQGTQLFIVIFIILFLVSADFLSATDRGNLLTTTVVLWTIMSTSAGYISACLYKAFRGEKLKANVLLTVLLCPGIVFVDFFLMNLILWVEGSSAAVPFVTLVSFLALCFGISLPLTVIGAYLGFKYPAFDHLAVTTKVPHKIPKLSFFRKSICAVVLGGIIPFGCIFIQLYFLLSSIWSDQIYLISVFLFLAFIVLLISCSETTILHCCSHVYAEDYHWGWRSFLTSGLSAVCLFIFTLYYFFYEFEITGAANSFLFFGYTMTMVFIFFLVTGTIGFFACWCFVNKINSSAASSQGEEGIFVVQIKEKGYGSIFEQKSSFTSPFADPM